AFVGGGERIERALRERQRNVGPRGEVRNRAEEFGARELAGAPGGADLHPGKIGEVVERLARAVVIAEAELEPRTEHLDAELALDLRVDLLPDRAVENLELPLERLAVEHRQLH